MAGNAPMIALASGLLPYSTDYTNQARSPTKFDGVDLIGKFCRSASCLQRVNLQFGKYISSMSCFKKNYIFS